jgi:sortase A
VTGGDDLTADILRALQDGVVRYPKSGLPNQIGNTFLTGHSSNYWWEKGRYKTVFVLLDKLVAGDLIYLKYSGTLYSYKVSDQKIVSPTESSVLEPTKEPILRLMTCTPTGTALKRRIVTANLIAPLDNLTVQTTSPTIRTLQEIR